MKDYYNVNDVLSVSEQSEGVKITVSKKVNILLYKCILFVHN